MRIKQMRFIPRRRTIIILYSLSLIISYIAQGVPSLIKDGHLQLSGLTLITLLIGVVAVVVTVVTQPFLSKPQNLPNIFEDFKNPTTVDTVETLEVIYKQCISILGDDDEPRLKLFFANSEKTEMCECLCFPLPDLREPRVIYGINEGMPGYILSNKTEEAVYIDIFEDNEGIKTQRNSKGLQKIDMRGFDVSIGFPVVTTEEGEVLVVLTLDITDKNAKQDKEKYYSLARGRRVPITVLTGVLIRYLKNDHI